VNRIRERLGGGLGLGQLPHETKIWSSRSPTRSAIAQTARHPSVDITDTTPAHTAAALRPDRHHTHGHQVTIVGWHLSEPYTLQTFCMNSSCPGRPMSANYSLVHARRSIHSCLRALNYGELHGKAHSKRSSRKKQTDSCLRHPTTPTGEGC
jgi:hypothetical protein